MSSPCVRWAYTLGCILPLSKVEKSEDVKPGSWRLEVHHLLQAGVGGDSSSFTTTTTLNRGQGVYPKHQSPWTTRTAAIEIRMFLRQFGFLEGKNIHSSPAKVSGKFVFCFVGACTEGQVKKYILKSVLTCEVSFVNDLSLHPGTSFQASPKSSTSEPKLSAKKLKPKTNNLEKNTLLS